MSRDKPRFGLYFIADSAALPGEEIYRVTDAALEAGVAIVQYRAKDLRPDVREEVARGLLALTDAHDVPLVVNDLPELALSAGASGVHRR